MKLIAVLTAIVAMPLLTSGALASSSDEIIRKTPPQFTAVDTTRIQATVKFRPPPLKLPDIRGRIWKIQRVTRDWLAPQLKKSKQVIAFFENPEHRWVLAPQKEKCWHVPWQRQCTLARAKVRLHTALAEKAQWRLDHELPFTNDWMTAIRIVQSAFPGTSSWLASCSDAEGGHGGFVVYGGGKYYPGAEYDQTFHGDMVGGNMQYMWGTFKGHYRRGLSALREGGYEVKLPDPEDVRAWLMPMAQAIAAGWARWSGNDNSHWSASFGSGC